MGGPRPAATAADAPQSPMACERRSPGKASTTSASEAGTSIAAPRAWTMRAATSRSSEGAAPQSADATVNSATPVTKARRRPSRSVRRPQTMRKAAKTMLYALSTQERLAIDVVGKDSRIEGNATLTMVASRKARKAPKQATRSTRVGCDTCGRRRSHW